MTGKTPADGLVNILSYDLAVAKSEKLLAQNFQIVIADERYGVTTRTKCSNPLTLVAVTI